MNFNIGDMIKYYFQNIILVLLILIVCIGSLFGIFYNYETSYIARTSFILGVCKSECANEEILNYNLNDSLIENYLTLIKTDKVIKKVIDELELDYSVSEVKKMINVSNEDDTQYITINVISTSEIDAPLIAKSLYETLEKEVIDIFKIDNLHLLDSDTESSVNVSRSYIYILCVLGSIIVSVVVIIIKFLYFHDSIKILTIEGIKENLCSKKKKKVKKTSSKKKNLKKK